MPTRSSFLAHASEDPGEDVADACITPRLSGVHLAAIRRVYGGYVDVWCPFCAKSHRHGWSHFIRRKFPTMIMAAKCKKGEYRIKWS